MTQKIINPMTKFLFKAVKLILNSRSTETHSHGHSYEKHSDVLLQLLFARHVVKACELLSSSQLIKLRLTLLFAFRRVRRFVSVSPFQQDGVAVSLLPLLPSAISVLLPQ